LKSIVGLTRRNRLTKTIVIVATLDTRGDEAKYLKELIEKKGCKTIVIDPGVLGEPYFQPDITREEVARAGGKSLKELVEAAHCGASRGSATEVMIRGVTKIVKELYSAGKLNGIVGIGGGTGTLVETSVMRELPIGVPKLMVTTQPRIEFVGTKDITMMHSVADVVGVNRVIRRILTNAAGAIVGMAEVGGEIDRGGKPLIGITCMGVTTPCCMNLIPLLEEKGYESVLFHSKTAALEELVEEGSIDGVIDVTLGELLDLHVYPRPIPEEPPPRIDRLWSVGRKGLPQIIVPGTLDMIILRNVPPELKNRKVSMHSPIVWLIRTTKEETAKLGEVVAKRANATIGPVAIVMPLRGFSAADKEGHELFDPEADMAFVEAVRKNVQKQVDVVEVDAHINDKEFAEKVVSVFYEISKRKARKKTSD